MNLLTEDETLLEVRAWRARAQEEYNALKRLPLSERQRIIHERNNEMLRNHGMQELPESSPVA